VIYKSLSSIKTGEAARIHTLNISGGMRQRLQDIGIIPETKIECLFSSAKDSIRAYRVRHSTIAIRREDAERITVVPLGVRI